MVQRLFKPTPGVDSRDAIAKTQKSWEWDETESALYFIALFRMASYVILWYPIPLHAIALLASARGLCLARRLYTSCNFVPKLIIFLRCPWICVVIMTVVLQGCLVCTPPCWWDLEKELRDHSRIKNIQGQAKLFLYFYLLWPLIVMIISVSNWPSKEFQSNGLSHKCVCGNPTPQFSFSRPILNWNF